MQVTWSSVVNRRERERAYEMTRRFLVVKKKKMLPTIRGTFYCQMSGGEERGIPCPAAAILCLVPFFAACSLKMGMISAARHKEPCTPTTTGDRIENDGGGWGRKEPLP